MLEPGIPCEELLGENSAQFAQSKKRNIEDGKSKDYKSFT